ncbi:MAG: hypothetical protein ACRDNJ_14650, partial [Solirubrobacteraceae bacterium]
MRTIEQIRALIITATDPTERAALLAEMDQARAATGDEKPSEIEQLRSRLVEIVSQRSTLVGQVEKITTAAVNDNGEARDYTADEAEQRGRLLAQIDAADERHTQIEDQVRQAEANARKAAMTEAVAQMRRELGLGEQSGLVFGGNVSVGNEPRTYESGNGASYLLDLCLARTAIGQGLGVRSMQAQERLSRHARENHVLALEAEDKISAMDQEKRDRQLRMTTDGYFLRQMLEIHNQRDQNRGPVAQRAVSYRALSTAATAGGEFVPPMYLTAQWIAFARPGRVLADLQHRENLPDGTMAINLPKVASGTAVGTQGVQNTNVANVS